MIFHGHQVNLLNTTELNIDEKKTYFFKMIKIISNHAFFMNKPKRKIYSIKKFLYTTLIGFYLLSLVRPDFSRGWYGILVRRWCKSLSTSELISM